MRRMITVCDRCGKSTESDMGIEPDGYTQAKLGVGNNSAANRYDFCPDCTKELGLRNERGSVAPIPTIKDRLFEVITEIVQGSTE